MSQESRFQSILFRATDGRAPRSHPPTDIRATDAPPTGAPATDIRATGAPPRPAACLSAEVCRDLHIDRIVEAIVAGFGAYDLAPFFLTSLGDVDAIAYRHEVMRDLERAEVMHAVTQFSERMKTMRDHLERSKKLYYEYEKQRWFLEAIDVYCDAVSELVREMQALELASRGLRDLRACLSDYAGGGAFRGLDEQAKKLKADLSAIRYGVLVQGNLVTVRECAGEPDTSAAVEATFEKFRYGVSKDYRTQFRDSGGLNSVEAQVLEGVARLRPAVFHALGAFVTDNVDYVDERVGRFDREVQFYVAYLAYVNRFRRAGLSFCYPQVSEASKEIAVRDAFDAALAERLLAEHAAVVTNDLVLRGAERIAVVTGPNQGGKTTFARMFGQLHHLASLGCLVPGTEARLFLFDRLLSHFPREEHLETLRGKLRDELVRAHRIVEEATPKSIVVVNEIFTSTTLDDCVFLSGKVLARLSEMDVLGVWVTFLAELASFDEKTVSVVGTVDPRDPAVRTYKLERKPADDTAYALAIAEKNRVTYRWLMERIAS